LPPTAPRPLPLERVKTKKRKRDGSPYRVEVYRCAACTACPDRARCTTSKYGRTVERTEHDDAFQRQRQKQRLSDNRFLLKQRGSIIERLFGEVKQCEGFRRWTVAGLDAVRAQWAMMCLTINLKRLYQWWKADRFTMAQFAAAVQATVRTQE
jgi:transposase